MLGSALLRAFEKKAQLSIFGFSREQGDLSHPDALVKVLDDFKPDVVIHAAAKVGGIQANIENQGVFLAENLKIDSNVISCSLERGVGRFIQIGSSCMYPANYRQPLVEGDLLRGPLETSNEGYALAKIAASKLCEFFSSSGNKSYRTIIPSNLYGPGDRFDPKSSHLLASVIRKVHEAKISDAKTIEVWGTGNARREFTYVDDLAEWLASSITYLDEFPQYVNVGFGRDYSVNEFYETALEAIGVDASLAHDPSKPEGMRFKLMDSTLAREKLNWNPKTDIREGILKTYNWFLRSHKA